MSTHYIYLLREREFLNSGQPIYKIGKTTQQPDKRLRAYPKQSEILLVIKVSDCHSTETTLIAECDKKYKNRKDIGREYYEAPEYEIMQTVIRTCYPKCMDLVPYNAPPGVIARLLAWWRS